MSDPTLFDAPDAKQEAIERVCDHAPTPWLDKAAQVVRDLARVNPAGFTSDHVWWILDACGYGSPPEPRALGAVFQSLAREGVIVKTGEYRDSERTENHSRPVCVWRPAAGSMKP